MSDSKIVIVGPEVTQGLARGVNHLANLVKITLGPKGKNVIIQRSTNPEIVNDGVTIARSVFLNDPLENMGAQTMKQVSLNTDQAAGDGTTTATVLAQSIINKGLELMKDQKINIIALKKEMSDMGNDICEYLKENSKQIKSETEIYNIAKISSNNDMDIADVLVKAYKKVGKNGYITVREPKSYETDVDIVKGMVYDRGYLSKMFVNDRKNNRVNLLDCYVALVDGELSSPTEVLALMEVAADENKGLLIIAEKFKTEVLTCLIQNKMAGFEVCAINSPGIISENVNFLHDIAAYCGGIVLNEKGGKSVFDVSVEDFGLCDQIDVYMDSVELKVKNINTKRVAERVKHINGLKKKTKEQFFLDVFDTRLAKLQGGIAVIYPGGRSDLEIMEKKLRVEDAVKAMKSALEMGFLPGGGSALIQARIYLENNHDENCSKEKQIAYDILCETLEAPFKQIVINCGLEPMTKIQHILEKDFWSGYDAKEDKGVNMYEAGIIDPTKVTVNALQNAISVSTTVLTTEGCIILQEEKQEGRTPLFGM